MRLISDHIGSPAVVPGTTAGEPGKMPRLLGGRPVRPARSLAVPERSRDDARFLWLALLPTAVVILAVVVAPLVYAVMLGFLAKNTLQGDGDFVFLDNYRDLLSEVRFWRALWNGSVYSVGTTLLSTAVGLGVALLLNQNFHGRGALRALTIFPYIVPTIVVTFIWKFIFSSRGLFNDLLVHLGLSAQSVAWLGDQHFAMVTVIFISSWAWFPFAAITLLAGLQSIPASIYEAAALDGAGPSRRLIHITLPLLAPAMMVVVLIRLIWGFRNFDMIWLLTGGGPVGATEVLPIMAYQEAFGSFRMGYAAAIAISHMLVMTLLAAVYFRLGVRLRNALGT